MYNAHSHMDMNVFSIAMIAIAVTTLANSLSNLNRHSAGPLPVGHSLKHKLRVNSFQYSTFISTLVLVWRQNNQIFNKKDRSERYKMCTNGKCLFCIPVEVGSLIFGIISSIVHAVCMLVCLGFLIYGNLIYERSFKNDLDRVEYKARGYVNDAMIQTGLKEYNVAEDIKYKMEDAKFIYSSIFNVVLSVLLLFSVISFTFSVLLCNGAAQRKPGQVRMYFIYGVVVAVFSTMGIIALFYENEYLGLVGLVSCSIYYLILVMVHLTYKKFNSGLVYNDHKRLIEDVCMS